MGGLLRFLARDLVGGVWNLGGGAERELQPLEPVEALKLEPTGCISPGLHRCGRSPNPGAQCHVCDCHGWEPLSAWPPTKSASVSPFCPCASPRELAPTFPGVAVAPSKDQTGGCYDSLGTAMTGILSNS